MDYIHKVTYHSCNGSASDIAALEGKQTYIEFLAHVNSHLEKTRKHNEWVEKQNIKQQAENRSHGKRS